MNDITPKELIRLAKEAMARAYAPYSGYMVGAALLAADGTVYQGCNVENAAFSPTNCAERTAFFRAICDGAREFSAIAVVGGKHGVIAGDCPPCGVCRQVMREFCGVDFRVYLCDQRGAIRMRTLGELLPESFSAETQMRDARE